MRKKCPLIKDECLEHGCEWFSHLVGKNPQTGAEQDEWGCAVKWLPSLLVENASWVRKATASTDKVANNVFNHHKSFVTAVSGALANKKLKELDNKDAAQQTGSQ